MLGVWPMAFDVTDLAVDGKEQGAVSFGFGPSRTGPGIARFQHRARIGFLPEQAPIRQVIYIGVIGLGESITRQLRHPVGPHHL